MEYQGKKRNEVRHLVTKCLFSVALLLCMISCFMLLDCLCISHIHMWCDQWPRPESFNSFYYFLASLYATLKYFFGVYLVLFGLSSWIWWSFVLLAAELKKYTVFLCYLPVQFLVLVLLWEQLANRYGCHRVSAPCINANILYYLRLHWHLSTALLFVFVCIGLWLCVWPLLKEFYRCMSISSYTQSDTWSMMHDQFTEAIDEQDMSVSAAPRIMQVSENVTTASKSHAMREVDQSYRVPSARAIFTEAIAQKAATITLDSSQAGQLTQKLARFGIAGSVVRVTSGPVVTLYEYEPAEHVKVSKILALEHDLALALKAKSMRILAPIPGKSVVGFEVANQKRMLVSFGEIAKVCNVTHSPYQLPLIIGKDTIGKNVIIDLARAPHMLVAGSTGSGKSVCLNTMLASILLAKKPQECKCILIDPKRLEFIPYSSIGHLLFPVITDPKQAVQSLAWLVEEMEQRYKLLARYSVRNIVAYNAMASQNGQKPLPYIVVLIDELADLMMVSGREIEQSIMRLTQMARAAGIHLIVATQRPSVDVITGLIKVNIPSRIAFQVTSKVDSRTILDAMGAECLLGKGDMLAQLGNTAGLQRLHGAYIDDASIAQLVEQVACQGSPVYIDLSTVLGNDGRDQDEDSLLSEIEDFIDTVAEISISSLQRRFHIGYNRSARLVEMLERKGRLMPAAGSKMRKVIK